MRTDTVDYIKCIAKEGKRSWCGSNPLFLLTDIEHAELAVAQEQYMIPCPLCLRAIEATGIKHTIPEEVIISALEEMTESPQESVDDEE